MYESLLNTTGNITYPLPTTDVLPYNFGTFMGTAIVYNQQIHILGGGNSTNIIYGHYAWDGYSWNYVSITPVTPMIRQRIVVYGGKLLILGDGNTYCRDLYVLEGNTWIKHESVLPNYVNDDSSVVVCNNKLHILGNDRGVSEGGKSHYSYDGTQWTQEVDIPLVSNTNCFVYNNEIYQVNEENYSGIYTYNQFVYRNNAWVELGDKGFRGSTLYARPTDYVDYNGNIYYFNQSKDDSVLYYYVFDGNTWTKSAKVSNDMANIKVVSYNGKIHGLGGDFGDKVHYVLANDYKTWLGASSVMKIYIKNRKNPT